LIDTQGSEDEIPKDVHDNNTSRKTNADIEKLKVQLQKERLANTRLAFSEASQEEQPVQLAALREEERSEGQEPVDEGHREPREQGKGGESSKASTIPLVKVSTPAGSSAAAVRQRVSSITQCCYSLMCVFGGLY
jgi:hypothetical protein